MTQVKAIKFQSFINHSFCEVTDFVKRKNDMWTEITNCYRHRAQNCWNVTSLKV